MSRRRSTTLALSAVIALTLVGGCSASDEPPASEQVEADFDVAAASLPEEPFCDRLDPNLVADLLGMKPDQVRLVKGEDEGGTPEPSTENVCVLGSKDDRFTVVVRPESNADEVQGTVERLVTSGACQEKEDGSFGEPASVLQCRGRRPEQSQTFVVGLVGGGMFRCSVQLQTPMTDDDRKATVSGCQEVLELLAQES